MKMPLRPELILVSRFRRENVLVVVAPLLLFSEFCRLIGAAE